MPDLLRWNDDRLDDLAEQVRRNTNVVTDLAKLKVQMEAYGEDTSACLTELRELKSSLEERALVQAREREADRVSQEQRALAQAHERKTDRRWLIGTLLTTAALVIAALGIFLG